MFATLPMPLSLIYVQGLERPTNAQDLRDALWCDDDGHPLGWEALGQESLADALPARFETMSIWLAESDALVVAEDSSRALTAWNGTGVDPFEALDEAFPAERLTIAHFDPAAGAFGLVIADDGLLQRRLYLTETDQTAWVSAGRIDAHERDLWDAIDIDSQGTADDLVTALSGWQGSLGEALQFVLTSMLANRLSRHTGIDLFDEAAAIWGESVVSFCLDHDAA